MLNITNKNVQELASNLNKTNDDERISAYAGFAIAYSDSIIKDVINKYGGTINSNCNILIQDMFYDINEIAVIDKKEFITMIHKFINFKLRSHYGANALFLTFDDISGVNDVFGKGLVEILNKNISIVRTTHLNAKSVIETL